MMKKNVFDLFMIDMILWCCNFGLNKNFYEKNK